MLYHVVAMAENRVIGKEGRLPWHFSSDLKHFKQLTMGQTILMGRKTFESIGKPLPGRENFVLSRTKSTPLPSSPRFAGGRIEVEGVKVFDSLENALKSASNKKIFVIGGASLYEQTMSLADGIYLTQIHENFEGDTFYPKVPKDFKEESRTLLQENPKLEVLFLVNRKKRGI